MYYVAIVIWSFIGMMAIYYIYTYYNNKIIAREVALAKIEGKNEYKESIVIESLETPSLIRYEKGFETYYFKLTRISEDDTEEYVGTHRSYRTLKENK